MFLCLPLSGSGDIMLTRALVCFSRSVIASLRPSVQGCVDASLLRILVLASTMAAKSGAQYGSPAGRLWDFSNTWISVSFTCNQPMRWRCLLRSVSSSELCVYYNKNDTLCFSRFSLIIWSCAFVHFYGWKKTTLDKILVWFYLFIWSCLFWISFYLKHNCTLSRLNLFGPS